MYSGLLMHAAAAACVVRVRRQLRADSELRRAHGSLFAHPHAHAERASLLLLLDPFHIGSCSFPVRAQVKRWSQQYAAAKTETIPAMVRVCVLDPMPQSQLGV